MKKTEEFVIKCFKESPLPKAIADGMIRHLLQTRKYVEKLSSEHRDTTALEIAALLHGIERAFRLGRRYKGIRDKSHEEKSMIITKDFLKKIKAPKKLIKKVLTLIERHETAPSKETKLLREADNISFLENTLPIWFEVCLWMGESREEIIESSKKVVDEKFKQIKSKKGKELAKFYHKKWKNWLAQKEENL